MFHSESGARTEEMGQEPQNGGGKKKRQESGRLKQWIMLECCTHLYKSRGLRCLEITHEKNEGKWETAARRRIPRTAWYRRRRRYEACRLWFDAVEGIMSAETHTQALCLSVNVTVRQEIIPTLMSKDAEIITNQSRERLQTQPAVLGGKAGAASALHVTDTTLQL